MAKRKSNKQVKAILEAITGGKFHSLVHYVVTGDGAVDDGPVVLNSYALRVDGKVIPIKAN